MTEGEAREMPTATPRQVGSRLQAAREEQGLALADIAQRTRIPLRHLEAIEGSRHGDLPSVTYAMGFARAYARSVGLDDSVVARDLRAELGNSYGPPEPRASYDPTDPARVPPSGLAIAGVVVALLIVVGIAIWYGSGMFAGEEPAVPTAATTAPTQATAPAPAPTPESGGQVTLVANDEVWVRVYDANDQTLLLKTMAAGERFDVPRDADNPMINVGRPDQLTVTINGSNVAPLGDGSRALSDVPISAEALRARDASTAPAAAPAA